MAFNPFDFQKQMFVEFEKTMGEYLQKTMRDPEFMKLMARGMEGAMDYRSALKSQVEATLKTLNVPTEESQEKLFQTLHGMETRILDLEEEVQELRQSVLQGVQALSAATKALNDLRDGLRAASAPEEAGDERPSPGTPGEEAEKPGDTPQKPRENPKSGPSRSSKRGRKSGGSRA